MKMHKGGGGYEMNPFEGPRVDLSPPRGALGPPKSRAWLLVAYGIVFVVAFALSLVLSTVGLAWQYEHSEHGFWLVPVNRLRTYLVPLTAVGVTAVALKAKRGNGYLGIASAFSVELSSGRLAYWWYITRGIAHASAQEFAAARAALWWIGTFLGYLAMAGIVCFITGCALSLWDRGDGSELAHSADDPWRARMSRVLTHRESWPFTWFASRRPTHVPTSPSTKG